MCAYASTWVPHMHGSHGNAREVQMCNYECGMFKTLPTLALHTFNFIIVNNWIGVFNRMGFVTVASPPAR